MGPREARPGDTVLYTDTSGCDHSLLVQQRGQDALVVREDGQNHVLPYEALEAEDDVRVVPAAGRVGEGEVVDTAPCPLEGCEGQGVPWTRVAASYVCLACAVVFVPAGGTHVILGPDPAALEGVEVLER